MTQTLMKSISGIRGIVGESLTPMLIHNVAAAFAAYTKGGLVVIGRDSRPTGEAILFETAAVLAQCGCDVIDVGIVPTPTVQVAVEELNARGGMVISASHNPIEWNAFKLINKTGTFLNEKEIAVFFDLLEQPARYVKWNKFGIIKKADSAAARHIERVLAVADIAAVRKKKYKVVLDSVNGAGSLITQELLARLNCTVVPLYCEMNGLFPRPAEPLSENLTALCAAVKKHGADIGFAQDPDADRLAIVDNTGTAIGEENTISLVAEYFLSRKPGKAVINLSTTKAVEDIAARHNSKVIRAKVGEINVVDVMRKIGADIGGEGNGGIISPEIHLGRDSLAGIVYVLSMMANRGQSLREILDTMPFYVMKKGKVKINEKLNSGDIISSIKQEYSAERISTLDGLRIDFVKESKFAGGWVHLRSSNTEPVFRIIAEGKNKKQANVIYSHFAAMFV